MKKKIFIFDWDGTLVNSADKIVGCMQSAAQELQLDALDRDIVKGIIGLGLPEAILSLYPELCSRDVERFRDYYSRFFVEADQVQCGLFPDVGETLSALKLAGHTLAVATGKSRKGLERALMQREWTNLFDATRCADETASKPHPLMLEEILAELGESSDAAVMVGDTVFDMEMAQRVNIDRIAVSYGVHGIDRLITYNPIACIDNIRSILDFSHVVV